MSTPRRLSISFSGGETSALMTLLILQRWQDRYDEIVITFANTGQENEETLEFVDWCDRTVFAPLGYRVIWIEAVVNGHGEGETAKVVSFETASRNGEPFEAMIRKRGIPNYSFKHCTTVLKENSMRAYRATMGWETGTYDTAIGIRADEMDRKSPKAKEKRFVYPLATEWPHTKPMVNTFWRDQPRRLRLKGYEGNCRTCWKKSFRKLYTLMREVPERFEFCERMEANYALIGPEFTKHADELPPGYHRVFFRSRKSVGDIRREAAALGPDFVPSPDDADVYVEHDEELDTGGACDGGESCEVGADDGDVEYVDDLV
jgi:hypothetical protein